MKECEFLYIKDEVPHCRRGCDLCVTGRVCRDGDLFNKRIVNKGWFLIYE